MVNWQDFFDRDEEADKLNRLFQQETYNENEFKGFAPTKTHKNPITDFNIDISEELITSPQGFTLNKEQSETIRELDRWFKVANLYDRSDMGIDERFYGIWGRPGVGKSECIWSFITHLGNIWNHERDNLRIVVAAPTNKVVNMLIEMAIKNGVRGIEIITTAQLLGMKPEIDEDGNEVFIIGASTRATDFGSIDLLVLDESSMTNLETWNHYNDITYFPPTIMMGDIEQLRPVKSNSKSKVFSDITNFTELKTPIRYGETIGTLLDTIKDNQQIIMPHDYADGDSILVLNNKTEWLNRLILEFASEEAQQDGYHVCAMAWRNDTVKFINEVVHKEVWKIKHNRQNATDEEIPNFETGMRLICARPITEWGNGHEIVILSNSTIVDIDRAAKTTYMGYQAWCLNYSWTTLNETGNRIVNRYQSYLIDKSDSLKLQKELLEIRERAVDRRNDSNLRKYIFKNEYYPLLKSFADLRHIYACTVHKQQGSTVRKGYIAGWDLFDNRNKGELKELYYTASSRAKDQLVYCF